LKDIFDKCVEFIDRPKTILADDHALAAELFTSVSPVANAGPWIQANGRKMLQFSTNDYLGLAMHPDVRARATEMVERYGVCSPMGSRVLTGTTEHHLRLEEKVARFKRTEAALTFATGSMAMMGALACVAHPRDILIMDQYAHASLVCGARISGAKILYFRHNDMDDLENILKKVVDSRALAIVVDGIYSMQGDMAPLPRLVELKKKYNARLLVDDAHGTGVCGENGRGTAAHFGVEDEIDLHMGTFSKALGTIGGFACGSRVVIDYIRYNAPTFLFTKAMPISIVAATEMALELLEHADDKRKRLWENTCRLQKGVRELGFSYGSTMSPITPIRANGTDALYIAQALRQEYGIWAVPVIYPGVHLGTSIVRVIPTASHSDSDIDHLIQSLGSVSKKMRKADPRPSTMWHG
jgi:8-amino-7-oxononanoate synthase